MTTSFNDMCLARWLSTSPWRAALHAVRTSRTLPCSIRTLLMGCFLNGYSLLRTWVSFFIFSLEPFISLSLCRCLSTIHVANDGHDSSITVAGEFANSFLTPLLANPNFNSAKTLIFLSMFFLSITFFFIPWPSSINPNKFFLAFDETSSSTSQNRVVGILLGSAVPTNLVGTSDSAFYDHYSQLATVEANWHLPTLGRYDVGANVFSFVAQQTGDTIRALTSPSLSQTLLDASYPGIFNSQKTAPLPIPNTTLVVNGRPVLPAIVQTWGSAALQACTVYNGSLGVPSAKNPPVLPKGCWRSKLKK